MINGILRGASGTNVWGRKTSALSRRWRLPQKNYAKERERNSSQRSEKLFVRNLPICRNCEEAKGNMFGRGKIIPGQQLQTDIH